MATTVFETEVCSRCGGTGHYSYNQVDGTKCFKCRGEKMAYTKRGRAAKDFYIASRCIEPKDVKIGDVIRFVGIKRLTVAKIELKQSGYSINSRTGEKTPIEHYIFTNENGLSGAVQNVRTTPGSYWSVQILPTAEQNQKLIAEALAYQETLTKSGKPRKIKG